MTTMLAPPQTPLGDESTSYVYAASNAEACRLIADLLRQFPDVGVQTPQESAEPLLVVECDDESRAQSLHDIVVTIDLGARLLQPSDSIDSRQALGSRT